MDKLTFRKGLKDGVPIALGYISVSFAFGTLAIAKGFPLWAPILISLSNFTGTGQFAGVDLIYRMAGFFEIACTVLVINLRYMLMSLSLSQKLSSEITLGQRLVISFGNTDEIYAVSMKQQAVLNYKYLLGLILCAFSGWVGGTALGACAGSFFPESVLGALGIALHAMFIAIIVPPARDSSPVLKIIILSICISCIFRYVPFLSGISDGWVIIICGIVTSALGAYLFPIREREEE